MKFRDALCEAEKWVDEVEGVESVAEGTQDGAPCITVFVSSPEPRKVLPKLLGRWAIVIAGRSASQ